MCGLTPANPCGDRRARAASRCSLPDWDPSTWDRKADRAAAGDAETKAGEIMDELAKAGVHLDFELDRDGCPMGWAVSRFARSVAGFQGTRTLDDPRRTPHYSMTRAIQRDDANTDRIITAVERLEAAEDGAFALYHEIRNG